MSRIDRRSYSIVLLGWLAVFFHPGLESYCAGENWVDWREAGPFVCRADFALTRLDGLLAELGQIQDDLVRCLGIPPAGEQIELYLFRNNQSYRRYLGRYLPEVPYRRALYVKMGGPGMVFAYLSPEFEVDVRHECTHALLHAALPVIPLWLDEGLAEYFEVPAQQRAFGNPHLASLRWSLLIGATPRLEDLENKKDIAEMGKTEYRNAWAWVHFMLHGPVEAHRELVGYLGDIQASAPPGVLSRRLTRHLPDRDRRITAHFKGWRR